MLVIGVSNRRHLRGFQRLQGPRHGVEVYEAGACAGEGAAACFGDLDEHGLVQGCNNRIASSIGFETALAAVAVVQRNRSPAGRAHADGVDFDASGFGLFRSVHGVVFVVFTVRQHNNDLGSGGFWIEACSCHFDGTAHCSALHRNDVCGDVVEKQFRGGVIGCDGALHIGVTREHHQPDAVAIERPDEPLDRSACQSHPLHPDVFRQHAVRHIHRDHDVHTFRSDFLQTRTDFRVEHPDEGSGQRRTPNQEPPNIPNRSQPRKHPCQHACIGQPERHPLLPIVVHQKQYQCHRQSQQRWPPRIVVEGDVGRDPPH